MPASPKISSKTCVRIQGRSSTAPPLFFAIILCSLPAALAPMSSKLTNPAASAFSALPPHAAMDAASAMLFSSITMSRMNVKLWCSRRSVMYPLAVIWWAPVTSSPFLRASNASVVVLRLRSRVAEVSVGSSCSSTATFFAVSPALAAPAGRR